MIKSTYICHLGNPNIQKNSACWYLLSKQSVDQGRYCPEICVRQVVANCCSCNLFSQIFQILDPPFDFIFPGIVWFPGICHSSATNFDLLTAIEFVYFSELNVCFPDDFIVAGSRLKNEPRHQSSMPLTFWKGNDKHPDGHLFSSLIHGFCHLVVLLFKFFLTVNDLVFFYRCRNDF